MSMNAERPNILWINLDQFRYDTPGFNGNTVCRTPAVDRLAGTGVNFTRAYTPCSLCTPARASMLTGRYAFTHGMGTNCDMYHSLARELPDSSLLLHTRLIEAGYRCGFVGKWHVGTKKGPADYGFEGMNVPGYGAIREHSEFTEYLDSRGLCYRIRPTIYMNPNEKTLYGGVWEGPTESTPPYFLADRTIRMIEEFTGASRTPFFIACNFWGPHGPHLPSTEYLNTHDRSVIPPWINFTDELAGKPARIRREQTDFFRARPGKWEEWRELVGLYYDFTSMIDAEIGRILDCVESTGLRESTLVILATDHGDMTGSHGGLLDKGFIYEEAHHIPLLVSLPGLLPNGEVRNDLVSNMDLFPTALDMCGLLDDELRATLDGRSLVPAICDEPERKRRSSFLMEFHGIRYLCSERAIVTEDGWKYVFNPADIDEVYDLTNDPGELTNLIRSRAHDNKIQALREELMRAVVAAGDPIMDAVYKILGRWENPSGQIDASRLK